MNCPACLSKLGPLQFGRVELDQCPDCEGMWFDQGELKQVSALIDDRSRGMQIDPWDQVRKMEVTVGKRRCPRCFAPMGVVCYPDPGVEVDVCLLCAGVWLDRDELNKILAYVDEQMSPKIPPRTEGLHEAPLHVPGPPETQPARDVSNVLGFVQQSVWDNLPRIREKGR